MKSTVLQSTLLGLCATALFAQAPAPPQQDGGWHKFGDAGPAYPPQGPGAPPQPYANAPAPVYSAPAPSQIIVPAGTWMTVRVNQVLSSDHNHTGDAFTATLAQPVIAQGFVVARRGQILGGRVTDAKKAGIVKGTSQLGIELTDLSLVDGQHIPLRTDMVQYEGGTSVGRDVAAVGTTTGVGAAIGAAAAGGYGAGLGAAAGAGASLIGVLVTRGKPTVIFPEQTLTVKLAAPLTISTNAAPQAFLQAGPQDYNAAPAMQQRRPSYAAGPYGPGPYAYPYGPYGYYGPGYYGPGIGIYGRFGRRW